MDVDDVDKHVCRVVTSIALCFPVLFSAADLFEPRRSMYNRIAIASTGNLKKLTEQVEKMKFDKQRPEYVVEHMEEDDPDAPAVFPKWALLE